MKKSVLRILVPGAIALCALMCLPSCQPQANTAGEEKAADETVFVPDSAFAQIDSLADFLIGELQQGKPEDFANRLESQTSAMKSYWHFNHQGENEEQMAETVCGELKALADKLAEGSTVDMERCGQLRCAVDRYLTTKEYSAKYGENKLYQEEMSKWLALEEQLQQFYVDLAQLANWGGSITRVNASGAMAGLAQYRLEDYAPLHKGGRWHLCQQRDVDCRRTHRVNPGDGRCQEPGRRHGG